MKKRVTILLIMGILLLTGCSKQTDDTGNENVQMAQNQESVSESLNTDERKEEGSASSSLALETEGSTDTPVISDGDIVEIREKMFVTQILDVYYNTEDYMGKQLKWQGIYVEDTDLETNEVYSSVIRYSPGCCGDDGVAGFEILLSDEKKPSVNDWVEVTGTLTKIESGGYEYLAVEVTDILIMEERGEEFVSN